MILQHCSRASCVQIIESLRAQVAALTADNKSAWTTNRAIDNARMEDRAKWEEQVARLRGPVEEEKFKSPQQRDYEQTQRILSTTAECKHGLLVSVCELCERKNELQKNVEKYEYDWQLASEQLTTVTKERDELDREFGSEHRLYLACQHDLTAAQAHIAQLREALEYFGTLKLSDGTYADKCCVAVAALSIPTDTAALDARLKDERERCAVECDKKAIGFDRQDFVQCEIIREMK